MEDIYNLRVRGYIVTIYSTYIQAYDGKEHSPGTFMYIECAPNPPRRTAKLDPYIVIHQKQIYRFSSIDEMISFYEIVK